MAISLSVNLNKIALIRNSREGDYPRVPVFAQMALDAGVQGITVHPRPDQRHIRPQDVTELAKLTAADSKAEFNIEGNPFAEPRGTYLGLINIARAAEPDQCTLVPDSDQQLTSDHGFNLDKDGKRLEPLVAKLKSYGIRVSLFMDPDLRQIQHAADLGADRIELYTGPYAHAYDNNKARAVEIFESHVKAAEFAQSIGLGVNAGHDLNLRNMVLYRDLPGLKEVSIGHALTVDALKMGFDHAVRAYLDVCRGQ